MPIDAVNSAMTPLQFARARSGVRSIETSAALAARSGKPGSHGPVVGHRSVPVDPPSRLLPPATFHWSYMRTMINGRPVAKRTPQFADTSYWSIAVNRLG